ncbi:50S ribosomal protein L25/general stress protein Ctc [Rhabdochlamydiaceae symbiont of Dictyostelium giganteum]|uniref:50S ribosomal protein L25/general stress protein Ctc n=1 Tax=Rhabdochlamydiaceae symbiont of Dictyostelium giganteum TaxID=3342349 RepID=UPI00384BE6CE
MKLTAHDRLLTKKSVIKQIRREGNIPAILYSVNQANLAVTISGEEMAAILRQMKPGHLGTTVFQLSLNGQERRVIIKDIQYHLTTYKVTHIDFEELVDDVEVSFKVPIQCVGVADCTGVKMGGFLRQIIRHVKVQALPRNMPSHLEIDVRDLGIKQSKKLVDIIIPEGVTPLAKMNEVVVVVSKRSN